ncbi:MAG TPA: GAF domain-containing protein, partial [Candidatus Udaeobacter sp.]|nr:GAF domain-containing protein [Candidatus Udaeobacter sp.]
IQIENHERENAFGESELRLLTTIAASLGTALENARLFDETQHLLKETEQRNAELAIINSVQEGLASKLDMQAIYDLVGDKIRGIFDPQKMFIVTLDHVTETMHYVYLFEKGTRLYPDPVPFNEFVRHHIRTSQLIVINEDFARLSEQLGMTLISGTQMPKSGAFAPLVVGNVVRGIVYLANHEREHAFSNSDVRLLQTLANSMSVALENARLFDETQRLLKETEQRNAELAIINSVQQGLSSKLEMQAIYELVGDKIQEIFNAQSVLIVTFDHASRLTHVPYNFEMGQRYNTDPYPFTGLHKELIQSGRTVLINENAEQKIKEMGMIQLAGTEV